jgi:hypothetical protein
MGYIVFGFLSPYCCEDDEDGEDDSGDKADKGYIPQKIAAPMMVVVVMSPPAHMISIIRFLFDTDQFFT